MRTFSQEYSQKLGQEIKQSQSEIGAAYSSIAHTVLLKVSSPTEALSNFCMCLRCLQGLLKHSCLGSTH